MYHSFKILLQNLCTYDAVVYNRQINFVNNNFSLSGSNWHFSWQNLPQQVYTFVCGKPRHAGDNVIIKLFASRAGTLVEARLTISVARLLKVYTSTIRGPAEEALCATCPPIAWKLRGLFFCIGDIRAVENSTLLIVRMPRKKNILVPCY